VILGIVSKMILEKTERSRIVNGVLDLNLPSIEIDVDDVPPDATAVDLRLFDVTSPSHRLRLVVAELEGRAARGNRTENGEQEV